MPVDMNALFREHGIPIELDGHRGNAIPFAEPLLANLDRDDLNAKTRQQIVSGDMFVAVMKRDENGNFDTDDAGRPKRSAEYLKLVAENNLVIMVPRTDEKDQFTRIPASNTRSAAASLIRLERETRQEIAENARAHARAMEEYEKARERGENVEPPEQKAARHDPDQFKRYAGFIQAVEAAISSEVTSPFASANERRVELMASLEIRNAMRNNLTSEQMSLIAQAESLREQIARIAPDHPMAEQAIVAPYNGNGEALEEGVKRLGQAGAGHFNKGVVHSGHAGNLVQHLMATFTRMSPDQIGHCMASSSERRKFEQLMARHEDKEIAASVSERVEAIMSERMPDYTCEVRFFVHQGVDYLMINDVGAPDMMGDRRIGIYAADSAARTQDLNIERLNRVPTEADVPTPEQIADLKSVLAEISFDNGGDLVFEEEGPAFG